MGCEFESTTVLPQWHVKDPGHSAKSAGGRLHLCTHAPLTQQSRIGLAMLLSRDNVGTYTENELTSNLSGNIRPRSSQLAEPHWTGPGIKSGISVRELISTLKKKRRRLGMDGRTFFQRSLQARKTTPPTTSPPRMLYHSEAQVVRLKITVQAKYISQYYKSLIQRYDPRYFMFEEYLDNNNKKRRKKGWVIMDNRN